MENTKLNAYFAIPSLVALAVLALIAESRLMMDPNWAVFAGGVANGVIGTMYFRWLYIQDDDVRRGINVVLASFTTAFLVFVAVPYILQAGCGVFGHQLWNSNIMGSAIVELSARLGLVSIWVCIILVAGMSFAASHPKLTGWLVLILSALGASACIAAHHSVWEHQHALYLLAVTGFASFCLNATFLRNQGKAHGEQRVMNVIILAVYAFNVVYGAYLSHTLAYSWQSLIVVGAGIATALYVRPHVAFWGLEQQYHLSLLPTQDELASSVTKGAMEDGELSRN